ncbi:MAG: hypothetical protein ACK5JT_19140 [Hyphomicrobiaceae bacterium]
MADLEYVQLMASLPALGPVLGAKSVPISGLNLGKRLAGMLQAGHKAQIDAAESILSWNRLSLMTSDDDFLGKAHGVLEKLRNPTLRRLVEQRLEQRTIIAALRRRANGEDAPPADATWGYGARLKRIRANWRDPSFGLAQSSKWLLPFKEKLESGDLAGSERLELEVAWRQADHLLGFHLFDFEAVALYVARWHLLDRWTHYDAEGAAVRFEKLLADALDAAPPELNVNRVA